MYEENEKFYHYLNSKTFKFLIFYSDKIWKSLLFCDQTVIFFKERIKVKIHTKYLLIT